MDNPLVPFRFTLLGAVGAMSIACSDPGVAPLPSAELQAIADELVARSQAPGAIVGVSRAGQRWIGAAGSSDLAGTRPMQGSGVFRAGSITKIFTAALVLERVEGGALRVDDTLAGSVPEFPNAGAITIDHLLAHTAGVTTEWFDGPILQPLVARDLSRVFSPEEVIELLRVQPPLGAPGASGHHYSNMGYVLLGQVLARSSGADVGALMRAGALGALPHTTYQFDNPQDLLPGWLEYQGLMLDTSIVPQRSFVSFAGAAGAVHSTVDDLLAFGEALFRDRRVVGEAALAHMMTPAEPGAPYGRGLMRFCPCDGDFSGWGHGGRLPGYFSVVVYYPERDVVIAAMINRDVVSGVSLGPEVFDPTLASVLRALESP